MRLEHILIILAIITLLSVLTALKIDRDYHYKGIKYLLSKHELKFYSKLIRLIPAGYTIMVKVRLADVVKSSDRGKKSMYGFNKIKSKHLDFVIIDSKTSEIKVVIELNDSSHNLLKRKIRDEFILNLLKSIGVPFIVAITPFDNGIKENLKEFLI